MSGQEERPAPSGRWAAPAKPLGTPSATPHQFTATPANFDGWAVVTETGIPSLPVGQWVYLRNANGRLLMQSGDRPIKGQEPAVLLDQPDGSWQWQQQEVSWIERKTPGWAIALGIVGLFLFLIGIVFFFVKTNVTRTGHGVRIGTPSGTVVLRYAPQK